MSFRSKPVVLGATDTDIYEVPVTLSAVVVLGIHNVVPSPAPSFTLKYYKQSTDTTTTLGTITFGSSPSIKYEVPFSMEPGDKIIGSASSENAVAVTPFITDNAAIPTAVGFDPIGEWNSGTTYGRNDIVRVEGVASPYVPGKTYISLQDNNQNQDPTTETAYWMVLVSDGAQGSPGTGDLSSGDIGTTIQPFDADTAKTDVAQTWTAVQTFQKEIVIQAAREKVTRVGSAATGTINFDALTQGILHYTTAASGEFTLNFRGDGSTTINSLMATDQIWSFLFKAQQGSPAYSLVDVTVDGSAVDELMWVDGEEPTGTISGLDEYQISIEKTADATFSVEVIKTTFAEAA